VAQHISQNNLDTFATFPDIEQSTL